MGLGIKMQSSRVLEIFEEFGGLSLLKISGGVNGESLILMGELTKIKRL